MCFKSFDGDVMIKVEEGFGFKVVCGLFGIDGFEVIVEMICNVWDDCGFGLCLVIDGLCGLCGCV